jgi:hypothetical protein
MRVMRTIAVLTTALTATAMFAVAGPGSAFAADNTTTAGEVSVALDKMDARNGNLVADTAQSTTVSVPNDPAKGVQFATHGQQLTIGIPGAAQSGKATKTRKGAVVYAGSDATASAVIPTTDGVQFLTTIKNRKAPTTYDYPVTLPQGGKVQVVSGGGAVVLDATGQPIAMVTAPWAKDANGKNVQTYFTTNGTTLTQHVGHRAAGVAYPVVADPWFSWYWNGVVITLSRAEMATIAYGGTQALAPMLLIPGVGWTMIAGVLGVAWSAGWAYANHQCAWFWIQTVWPFVPSTGYYSC